ncbi:MAG: hypothetical protein ACI9JN_002630, partial [Bacteroidia bacterium]
TQHLNLSPVLFLLKMHCLHKITQPIGYLLSAFAHHVVIAQSDGLGYAQCGLFSLSFMRKLSYNIHVFIRELVFI